MPIRVHLHSLLYCLCIRRSPPLIRHHQFHNKTFSSNTGLINCQPSPSLLTLGLFCTVRSEPWLKNNPGTQGQGHSPWCSLSWSVSYLNHTGMAQSWSVTVALESLTSALQNKRKVQTTVGSLGGAPEISVTCQQHTGRMGSTKNPSSSADLGVLKKASGILGLRITFS